MARKPRISGYIVRQALNEIERGGIELNRAMEQLLTCESAQVRAMLIAKAAIAANKIGAANWTLRAVLLNKDGWDE
jgi:hypothetical protein